MGLFSFLGGGKKKAAVAGKPTSMARELDAVAAMPAELAAAPVVFAAPGSVQVKLRLKLAASLRTGQHAKAYEAAKGLADIQAKAGRRMAARVWREQAERILERDGGQRAA
ncbi:MAG: hypothetical protein Q8R02_12375 [Hyphomonadaceae bacterium]|nr:hypothetical protein [Hyphomonadaceae bacterium]